MAADRDHQFDQAATYPGAAPACSCGRLCVRIAGAWQCASAMFAPPVVHPIELHPAVGELALRFGGELDRDHRLQFPEELPG